MEIINMRTGSWGKLVAFFDVKTDEGFIIKGFKLFNGINGLFAGMPSEKRQDENGEDKYFDTIWLTDETRENMSEKLNNMASDHYNKNSNMDMMNRQLQLLHQVLNKEFMRLKKVTPK